MGRLPLVACVAAATASCTPPVRMLPPPSAPEPLPAPVDASLQAPPAGFGRILLSSDVPARVERVSRYRELLCESTPCDVTLPYGDYELGFVGTLDPNRGSTATLHVHEPLVALRHVLGASSPAKPNAGPIMIALGTVLALSSLLAFAAATGVQRNGQPDSEPAAAAGVLCVSGLGLMIGGAVVVNARPSTEQPGATTQWAPPLRPAAGASLSLRF